MQSELGLPILAIRSEGFGGDFRSGHEDAFRALRQRGGHGRHAAVGAKLVSLATGGVLGVLVALVAVALGRGWSDPMLLEDALRSGVVGMWGGLAYVSLFSAGSVLSSRGWGRPACLIGDWLLGSSPSALASILETLQLSKPAGRKLLVMGDMLELGPIEGALHRAAGKRAASAGVELLVTVGPLSRQSAESARRSGVSEVHQYADSTKAADPLLDSLKPGDLVVVKGSRAMKMERVVDTLIEAFGVED